MVNVELSKEDLDSLIGMMEGSTIQMSFAEKGLSLLNKLKEANK